MTHQKTREVLQQAEEILNKIKGKKEPKFKFKELIFFELNKKIETNNKSMDRG
jgi:hypothetical protein